VDISFLTLTGDNMRRFSATWWTNPRSVLRVAAAKARRCSQATQSGTFRNEVERDLHDCQKLKETCEALKLLQRLVQYLQREPESARKFRAISIH
jgi:hypothetical protein